jgi:fumarate reductase iron-sulfur subunit
VARWTCRTHVGAVADKGSGVQIAPLANLPVIRDLATDMREFFNKWTRAKGYYKGSRTRHDDFAAVKPASKEAQALQAGIECIGCGVCYASCDVVTWRSDYLGPAALNRAWTLLNDVRDGARSDRLRAVAGDAGCLSCHTHITCTELCPKHISPTASIAGLKRASVAAAIKGQL